MIYLRDKLIKDARVPMVKAIPAWAILAVILAVTLASSAVFAGKRRTDINSVLKRYGVRFRDGGDFLIEDEFRSLARDKSFHKLTATKGEVHIEMEVISPVDASFAQDYSNSKYVIIKSLYEPQVVPYTGELTSVSQCPVQNRPVETSISVMGGPVKVFAITATSRYVPGAWEDRLVKNRAFFAMVHDPAHRTLHQIMIFYPAESFSMELLPGILGGLEHLDKR